MKWQYIAGGFAALLAFRAYQEWGASQVLAAKAGAKGIDYFSALQGVALSPSQWFKF